VYGWRDRSEAIERLGRPWNGADLGEARSRSAGNDEVVRRLLDGAAVL
jgi:hypothetical protein